MAKRTRKKIGDKKKCKVCGDKIKAQKKDERAEENKKKKAKEVHLGELAAFNEKAKQMGLTYGQYMIFLQTKKDQEERAKIS